MHTGPRPLMTHLGLALSSAAARGEDEAIVQKKVQSMMDGIKKYQNHPYKRSIPDLEIVWKNDTSSLQYCPASAEAKKGALFILPSMINEATILDILENQSFVRWMAGQGYDVYLLDWGNLGQGAPSADIDDIFKDYIAPSLKYAADNNQAPLHILGYCMGGTLAAAAAQIYEECCASVTMLAAPWDFHAGDENLTKWVKFWAPTGLTQIMSMGYLPSDWIQSVFASLDPFQTMQKFTDFAALKDDDPKAALFVAVEDWLNAPVHLPGPLAQSCIQEWFIDNKAIEGRWQVLGQAIAPEQINIPIHVVASIHDRLVPYESSTAFLDGAENASHTKAECGHIGFMASRKAPANMWAPIAAFLDNV